MWEFFIRNNRFSYLFLVALFGIGIYTIIAIPKESAPEVIIPVGIVNTLLPGAPAADVESLITNEIERGLSGLENVKQITSVSRENLSSITVEFNASADLDTSIQDLKDEIDRIKQNLPTDADDPSVSEVNFVDQPILTIALAADLRDESFTELANEIERDLESLANISKVNISGVRNREITVVVNQAELRKYDLVLSEVTSAIRDANLTFPIGQINNNGIAYNIAFEGDITNSQDINNIGIAVLGGQPVYVRDVATVIDGLAPATSLSRLSTDGKPSQKSISLDIYKQSGGDITAIARSVNARLTELQQPNELLDGVTVVAVQDAGKEIENDLIRLSSSGLQTVVLVIILLIVAIGWREGLLAGAAIPLSFLFGFIGLYVSGNTINFLSLFALILGIGILVDSAIVMVEGINRKMKDDPTIDKREAAISTTKEYASPLISGTLTTVAMFVGLFIVSGVIGQFIASIPFTLIFILFASLFVALAIIPLFAASVLKRRSSTKMEQAQVRYAHQLESWYRKKLDVLLGFRAKEQVFLWGVRIALILALLLPVTGIVKVVFFEQGDVDYVIVELELPEGTTKEITDIGVRRVEELLFDEAEIESYVVTIGSGSQFGSGGNSEKLANIFISLRDDRVRTSSEIVETLRQKVSPIQDINVSVTQPSDGPPAGAAIVVKFLGEDLTELTRIANESAEVLKTIPNTTNIKTSTNNNNTEFVLELDRIKAASVGVSPATISSLVRAAVFGSDATSLTTLNDDIDVVVKLNVDSSNTISTDNTNAATIDAVTRIQIMTPQENVPLSDLVTVRLRESSTVINHEDSNRVVTLTADVTTAGNARDIQTEVIQAIRDQVQISDDITVSTGGGETDDSNKAFLEMFLALVVGIVLMIAVLTLQFNSYLHTRYVLSILPYSLIGIMIGLAITQNPLSFPSIMGFIALSGIVVNNSILLIDMMNQRRKENPDKPVREIVIEAASNRLRPILLTTMTTVTGMIPLTYAGDLWAPLAYAVMFGLIFSVIITLVLIPIVYTRNPGTVN